MPDPSAAGDRWSVPISALEHYAYCPRQAVLIWQEAYFESNVDTVRGDLAHEAVDRGGTLTGRVGARIWRSLPVHSDDLAVHGICDTVVRTVRGLIPVEHKSGTYKPGGPADLQVAAQVLCLREMFDRPALALDPMEEFRPLLVGRLVLTLANREQIKPTHTETLPGGQVQLTDEGRKFFLEQWSIGRERSWTHTYLDRKIPAALLPLVQARLLARHLRGDTDTYIPWAVA
ncbi:CRISPR-associated endonuclease Cas1 [Nocardia nepalensis]|uniref:CRISPR-associated endonuclease Cas1 n=1 Tax=Nocardia nepalensis TaxID=3375448 RepID=UPI003B680391